MWARIYYNNFYSVLLASIFVREFEYVFVSIGVFGFDDTIYHVL